MTEDFDLYLASASPRRRELLQQIGVRLRLLPVEVPEHPERDEAPGVFVKRVALAKARAGVATLQADDAHAVLGADTAVVVDGEIFGKPRDKAHGVQMLTRLAGKTHQVMSAVALMTQELKVVRLRITEVTFSDLSSEQIEAYWESGECHDKAGAYAIQGRAAVFIKDIKGSYSAVMGLPLYETAAILHQFGILPLEKLVS